MKLSQLDALLEQAVNVRRGDASAMRADVAPAEIVGEQVNDVGLGCRLGRIGSVERGQRRQQQGGEDGEWCVSWFR